MNNAVKRRYLFDRRAVKFFLIGFVCGTICIIGLINFNEDPWQLKDPENPTLFLGEYPRLNACNLGRQTELSKQQIDLKTSLQQYNSAAASGSQFSSEVMGISQNNIASIKKRYDEYLRGICFQVD